MISQRQTELDIVIGRRIREESKIERGLWTSPLGTRDIESAASALGIHPAALLVGAGAGELVERFISGGEGSAMAYLADRISRLLGKPPGDPG
jgi:hypothetical protein